MVHDPYLLSQYHYDLPEELIAQRPCYPRDQSRLMVIDRAKQSISEMVFSDILGYLKAGDHLVLNDTKVLPARLVGKRKGGGQAEVFLSRPAQDGLWEALIRPGKRIKPGGRIFFDDSSYCEVVVVQPDGSRLIKLMPPGNLEHLLKKHGHIPLPHYIQRSDDLQDVVDYQTVYAKNDGAVAAPTAGLHFTQDLLAQLKAQGVDQTHITLHTGLGTFRTVQVEDIRQHSMHAEWVHITEQAAAEINKPRQGRRICVGTTTVRTLESAANEKGEIVPGSFETSIFIYPGYQFKQTHGLLTNFHLPGSTLLMLVSAFAGYELVREAYQKAVKEKFRFFSYGDAMLIL